MTRPVSHELGKKGPIYGYLRKQLMEKHADGSIRAFLVERYRNFREEAFPQYKEHFAELANEQKPRVLFIACSDSRVVPNVLLSGIPGDIFECRIVGNIVPSYGSALGGVSATIEFAVSVLKVQAIIICGHSDCGAMKGMQSGDYSAFRAVSSWLQNGEAAMRIAKDCCDLTDEKQLLKTLTRENVLAQIANTQTHPAVAVALRHGLELLGWVYDIKSGEIECFDPAKNEFVPLEQIAVATR
jgi:carbonic anhydrase